MDKPQDPEATVDSLAQPSTGGLLESHSPEPSARVDDAPRLSYSAMLFALTVCLPVAGAVFGIMAVNQSSIANDQSQVANQIALLSLCFANSVSRLPRLLENVSRRLTAADGILLLRVAGPCRCHNSSPVRETFCSWQSNPWSSAERRRPTFLACISDYILGFSGRVHSPHPLVLGRLSLAMATG